MTTLNVSMGAFSLLRPPPFAPLANAGQGGAGAWGNVLMDVLSCAAVGADAQDGVRASTGCRLLMVRLLLPLPQLLRPVAHCALHCSFLISHCSAGTGALL